MDYSAINNDDPEHPVGHDPWASSPQATKTTFSPRTSIEDPSSPTPNPPQSGLPDRSLESRGGFGNNDDEGVFRAQHPAASAVENGHVDHERTPSDQLPPSQQQQQPRPQQQYPPPPQPNFQQAPMSQQQQNQGPTQQPRQAQRYRQRPRSRQDLPQQPHRFMQPKVNGIERPTRKDLIVRFDIHTNLPGYRTSQFRDIRRTHVEFERLADHLVSANPESIVPALPPSSTPAGIGTDEDESRVRYNMQHWLSIVCGNDVLMRDDEMMRFIESDPGYSPVFKRTQPATGVRRKYLKQFGPPPDDCTELIESRPVVKRFYLGAMDAGQKVDKAVKSRRTLGATESDLASKFTIQSETEPHPGLKHALRKLGRTVQTVGDLHSAQATSTATLLAAPLHYHSADAFIAKETLTNRHILLRDLAQAQQTTRSKLSATDRLKASSSVRRDKVDEAIAALDEARSAESHLDQKTARVTQNLVHEQRAWFARTEADLRGAIRELVVREIESERRVLAVLEAVRPDVRAIDASGGLSRLGREAAPGVKRAVLQSSQGPKGDAWSGVERRLSGLDRSISGSLAGVGTTTADAPGSEAGKSITGGDAAAPMTENAEGSDTARPAAKKGQKAADEDADRVDARNAASRLASSTF